MRHFNEQTAEVNEVEFPYGGCRGGLADEPPAEDAGGEGPREQEGNVRAEMAALRQSLRSEAARIERETGYRCTVTALVSSENTLDGFLVTLTVGEETFTGNAPDLWAAEDDVRWRASVAHVERRKAVAAHA